MKHPSKNTVLILVCLFCGILLSAQQDLYWGNSYDGILKYDHDLDSITTVVPIPTHSPQRMVLNHQDSLIYWTDSEHRKIYQCDYDGSNQVPIISVDSGMPYGLAYDPTLDLIFYSDFENGTIYKYDISSDTSILIHDGLTSPIQLQLDTLNQDVYWLDEAESIIGKVDYLGANDSIIIDTILPYLQCFLYDFVNEKIYYSDVQINIVFIYDVLLKTTQQLALDTLEFIREMKIDYTTNKLYWVDARLDLVFSSNLDGSQQQIIYDSNPSKKPNRFFSILTSLELDLTTNNLYFMDLTLNKLNKISLANLLVDSLIISPVYWPSSVIVSYPLKKIIWSEAIHGQIFEYSFETKETNIIHSQPELYITGLALDERTNILYITDRFYYKVFELIDGNINELLVLEDIPTGIILDTFDNKLYYLVQSRANIWRSNLDGSNNVRLLDHFYIGLATECIIDRQNSYIYWNLGNYIRRNKIEFGNNAQLPFPYNPEVIFADSVYCIAGMVINVNLNKLYFVQKENLYSLNLDGTDLIQLKTGLKCDYYNSGKMTANSTNLYVNDSIGNPCNDFNPCTFNTVIQYNGTCGGGDTLTQDNTFMGPGNDWHQSANWSLGMVPEVCHDVIIPSPHNVQILTGSSASSYTLDVKDGASLITQEQAELEVLHKNDP